MLHNLTQNNDFTAVAPFITESSEQNFDQETLWDKLNLSQQFSVCSLGQFGYKLVEVRYIGGTSLAILKQMNKTATINVAGTINTNPAMAAIQ